MQAITVKLVSSYAICSGHRLYRDDWTPDQNQKVFGKCTNQHGHQYTIELHLTGPVSQESGMLINGFEVDDIARPMIYGELDHRNLNDLAFFKDRQPTAEWIAFYVFDSLKNKFPAHVSLSRVVVKETPELAAEYPAA